MQITLPGAAAVIAVGIGVALMGPTLATADTTSSASSASSSIECPTNASDLAPGKSSNQPPGQAKKPGTAASSVAPGQLMQDCPSSSSSSSSSAS